MTVKELINYLHECPPESQVRYFYEGAIRNDVDAIFVCTDWEGWNG